MSFAPSKLLPAILMFGLSVAGAADEKPAEAGRMYPGPLKPTSDICTLSAFVAHSDKSVWPTALRIDGFRLEGLTTKPAETPVVWELLPGQKSGILELSGAYVVKSGAWSWKQKQPLTFDCKAGYHHAINLVAELVPDTVYESEKPFVNWKKEVQVKRRLGSPYSSDEARREALERGCRRWKTLLEKEQWCPIP